MELRGVDFTSRPGQRKPITLARGVLLAPGRVRLDKVEALTDFAAYEAMLAEPGPWIAGFDFPFSFARELIEGQGWPTEWPALMRHMAGLPRQEMAERFRRWCQGRPSGNKLSCRATERAAGSNSSMQWFIPPVAYMLREGAPRLLAAGVDVPGLHRGDPSRVALEAYPAILARAVLGRGKAGSYKHDLPAKQTAEHRAGRERIVAALSEGRHNLGIGLELSASQAAELIDDASGDRLDAVLCMVQAAWAEARREQGFGLPQGFDPLEGWIITA
ncbi:DUF429 domain-containing protein [Chitinimonas lacunae]|uniref:DUF429 domain-containing protein n=1 Tax=Chitinimonas lacunae TaxID=1963018 RepID=A0ABV8MWK0_9NEIS